MGFQAANNFLLETTIQAKEIYGKTTGNEIVTSVNTSSPCVCSLSSL